MFSLSFSLYRSKKCLVSDLPTRHTPNKCLHSGSGFLLHFVRDVSIHVQSKCSGGMVQIALDNFDVITGADSGNGVAMPEIVEAGTRSVIPPFTSS